MPAQHYRYEFSHDLAIEDVEASLLLAIMAAESLFGESQTRLEARHFLDVDQRACIVDVSTSVGDSFNKLFTGFLTRECGPDSFTVRPVRSADRSTA
ncbi:hypothetical protein ETAA8_39500 [Anatilimnocola aggregata]|uniref:Uncharacterized protein n=1 Tax=Anatilimnocola aggregata TaxID=2528021 RepID=A0A517YF31_9BACT|nr:hypothetical protein [Anatilimnocola aggregata]QDU28845.1 hypothetical protein ETAA8_39500 [Anatilimnocola aggregata]